MGLTLPKALLGFTGYWNDPTLPECVEADPVQLSIPPTTGAPERCPDGSAGPCDMVWESPLDPIDEAWFSSSTDSSALPGGGCSTTDIE